MAYQNPAEFWSGYRGPMTDAMEYTDPLGGRSIMEGDASAQSTIEDMLMGRGDQYSPSGIQAPPMFPEAQPDPQDFIGMQLAGDVVPMHSSLMDQMQAIDRLSRGTGANYPTSGIAGQASINRLGGRQSPYLDLMDVLQFPGGQPYPRR